MKTRVSLITEHDEADLETRLAEDITFVQDEWGISPDVIQFSTGRNSDGSILFCVLVIYILPIPRA